MYASAQAIPVVHVKVDEAVTFTGQPAYKSSARVLAWLEALVHPVLANENK